MTALLGAEARRLLTRRLCRVLGALLLVVVVAAPFAVDWAFRERARIERDADLERCVQGKEPKVRDGVTVATISPDVQALSTRERLCRAAIPHRDGTFRLTDVDEVLRPAGALVFVAAFALGASFIGADAQTGALAMQLSWEGRRGRLAAAKTATVMGATFVAVALWEAALVAVLARTSPSAHGWVTDTAWLSARVAAVAAGAACIGCALALLGRATSAALGAGLAYVLVLETLLSTNFKPLRPWLVVGNATVFVKGRFEGGPGGDIPGRTVGAAALILGAYLAACLVTAVAVFRRRDVT